MTTLSTLIEQPLLFPVPPEEPATHISTSPPPRPAVTTDTLLAEIEHDWWSLFDPRNWRDPGPTDEEILARYRAADTPTADDWPNVSGHRIYSLVWPALRLTYQTPDERLLAACQTCRHHHLQDALASTRIHAIDYSISADLIGKHVWNGDSWTTYTALARFARQPATSLESLVTETLQRALHHGSATFHIALAARYRPPIELRPSKHVNAEKQAQNINGAITQARERLKTLRDFARSPTPTRTLLEHATIGPRFENPAWPTLAQGDSLPSDLIDAILRSHAP